MNILGIDPGLKGGFCLLNNTGIISVKKMPIYKDNKHSFIDTKAIKEYLDTLVIDKVAIEKQIVIKGQGLSSSSKTMYQYGLLIGILTGMGYNINIYTAKFWQKIIFSLVDDNNINHYNYDHTKIMSIAFVEQRYNSSYLFFSKRQKKPNDGVADAICIAAARLYEI